MLHLFLKYGIIKYISKFGGQYMEKNPILIPENYEEAKKRKEEVLQMINSYNEALFNEEVLPFTDEEIRVLQEEYLLLDDYVELTDTEKKIINKDSEEDIEEIVNDDGTIIKRRKESFWDKVNPFIFVYAVFVLVGSLWFAIQGIGIQMMQLFSNVVSKLNIDISGISENGFLVLCIGLIAIYPILFCVITLLVKIFLCRNNETKKVAFWLLMSQILVITINYVIVIIEVIKAW